MQPWEAERRLRLGYVSPDFCEHAVTLFFEPILESHDRATFEVFCYHTGSRMDGVTGRLRRLADHWRTVTALSADRAADLIRHDRIDILVDLAGHTAHNGLPIFARKPAPIQLSWLGYPGTTGLTRIDGRLVEPNAAPPGQDEPFHTERLIRLDSGGALRPPMDAPPITPPPLLTSGRPRFGSFNRPQKIGPRVIAVWSRILHALPDASLLMVVPGGHDADIQEQVRAPFRAEGIDGARIEVAGLLPVRPFLELVAGTDIALDPFPYSGSTTTTLTLWMGVPVICLAGDDPTSSTSADIVACAGLQHLIASDEEHYVDLACRLARASAELTALRGSLRRRLAQSALRDESWMIYLLERIYRRLWRAHVMAAET